MLPRLACLLALIATSCGHSQGQGHAHTHTHAHTHARAHAHRGHEKERDSSGVLLRGGSGHACKHDHALLRNVLAQDEEGHVARGILGYDRHPMVSAQWTHEDEPHAAARAAADKTAALAADAAAAAAAEGVVEVIAEDESEGTGSGVAAEAEVDAGGQAKGQRRLGDGKVSYSKDRDAFSKIRVTTFFQEKLFAPDLDPALKSFVIQDLLPAATKYWAAALRVVPVRGNFRVPRRCTSNWQTPGRKCAAISLQQKCGHPNDPYAPIIPTAHLDYLTYCPNSPNSCQRAAAGGGVPDTDYILYVTAFQVRRASYQCLGCWPGGFVLRARAERARTFPARSSFLRPLLCLLALI